MCHLLKDSYSITIIPFEIANLPFFIHAQISPRIFEKKMGLPLCRFKKTC